MSSQQELRPDSGGTGAGDSEEHESRVKTTSDPEQSQKPWIWRYQEPAERLYQNDKVQYVVATLIMLNFLTNIIEKEIDPYREFYPDAWGNFETFYNVVFTIELALNMYGTWFRAFWQNGWNVFDFVVVAIGLLDAFNAPLPGPFKLLRMMRAFRVFRLFRKVESLNKIVTSLVHAVPGMMNAFFINLLFMCIYAVLAVEFFGYSSTVLAACKNEHADVFTGRELCHNVEYYGSFGRSVYTLFQVLIGDSWSEAVVRPIMHFYDSPIDQFFSVMFFISFMLLNCVVLINVVVAVLLDKMAAAQDEQEEEEEKEQGDEDGKGNAVAEPEFPEAEVIRKGIQDLRDKMRKRLKVVNERVTTVNQQVSSLVTVLDSLTFQGGRWKWYRVAA